MNPPSSKYKSSKEAQRKRKLWRQVSENQISQNAYQNQDPVEKALSRPYDRLRDLPSLIPLWPAEMGDFTSEGTAYVLAKVSQYLRAERRRSIKRHWSYNLNKHAALVIAFHHETRRLKSTPEKRD